MIVPWWGLLPFVAMLLCIAVLPLVETTRRLWEDWRFQLLISLTLGLLVATWVWLKGSPTSVAHALCEYAQFIALLFSLFVVAGGIAIRGNLKATPRVNATFLAIGAVAASFIGTTGAAMLLIRPILNINRERTHRIHTVVFTILMVANCGGLLTPLGDPPLFLGMLRGVPFVWTFSLWREWLFMNGMLLAIYYLIDRRLYTSEPVDCLTPDREQRKPIRLAGGINFVFFAVIIATVALVPSLNLDAIEHGHAAWHEYVPWREIIMLVAAGGSFFLSNRDVRMRDNEFTWSPIREVSVLFIGIFLTMIPALSFLGQAAHLLPLNNVTFFAFSGLLSAVLDNAPTYSTFFEMAIRIGSPDTQLVAGVPVAYLAAISTGSVFCGALTYIGNGPNFMVKAVADAAGVTMPSFAGYLIWTLRYLVPTLVAMACIFVVGGSWVWVGAVLATVTLALGLARPPGVASSTVSKANINT